MNTPTHQRMSSSSSVVLLRKSSDASAAAVGFSLWMNKMSGMESQVNVVSVGNVKVDAKTTVEQEKPDQGGSKKKLCACAPTTHPGSFRCRYHRATSVQKVNLAQDPAAAVAKHFLKLGTKNTKPVVGGVKPQPSRFGKAAAAASSELPS